MENKKSKMDSRSKATPARPSAPISFDSVATADESKSPDNSTITDDESNSVATSDGPTSPGDPRISYNEENASGATTAEPASNDDWKWKYCSSKDKITFQSGRHESFYGVSGIEYRYDKFCHEIGGLSKYAFQPTPWDKLKAEDRRKLTSWTPCAKRFIESTRGFPYIFGAWIWRILDEEVFSADPQTKWRNHDDSFDAVKYLGGFIASIESQFITIVSFLAT
jgi:hypothetical protein